MQFIVVLLLVVALALLVLGLIDASSALVVGSIVASLLAVALLVRVRRSRIGTAVTVRAADRTLAHGEAEPPAADTTPPLTGHGQRQVWVIDGRPRYHLAGCDFLLGRSGQPIPLSQAVEDGFTPCARCDPDNRLGAAP
ncbi:MAG TPA: hypothetical protein VJ851_08475 [Jatrophihabitans sp.]|nr:hypothetical protein [Jatrophihabitans sp.]